MGHFKELEKQHRRTAVTVDMPGQTGHGVLALDGHVTEIQLLSPSPLQVKADENEWFDLRLKEGNGAQIFVHHGLFTLLGRPTQTADPVQSAIFPNFLAFGADRLAADGHVTLVSFTATGLIDFFYYPLAEHQSLRRATPKLKKALKAVRNQKKNSARKYEFFAPDGLVLTHRLPRVMEFRVGDRRYRVFVGLNRTLGSTSHSVRAVPHAEIEFDKPVTIESAIGHAWEWRRFFSQLALEPLPFESLSVRAKGRPRGYAELYLPNLDETPSRDSGFGPGLAPFNSWKERGQLAAVMQGWLANQPKRRVFRASLERVLRKRQDLSTPDHVLRLAAGIDGLTELDTGSSYSKKDVKTLVDGALAAAKEPKIDIKEDRLQGLLGNLHKQNLSRRLKAIGDKVAPLLTDDPEIVFEAVQAIRNSAAHGNSGIEASIPKVAPATDALAAICAIWDQQTSGMPIAQLDKKIHPVIIATRAIRELKQLESK